MYKCTMIRRLDMVFITYIFRISESIQKAIIVVLRVSKSEAARLNPHEGYKWFYLKVNVNNVTTVFTQCKRST